MPSSSRSAASELLALEGVLEGIVYRNDDNSWTVVRLKLEDRADAVTAVGHLTGVQPGETLRVRGRWSHHARFGEQFEVKSFVTLRPSTLTGIENYLGSGLVPGLGPVIAKRLVARFGLETLHVIDHQPARLSEVDGIGPKRRERILAAWQEHRAIAEIMVFLQTHAISSAFAARIFKAYGARAAEVVRTNPYQLALDIHGIGFRSADRVALACGIARDAPRRIVAGIIFYLEEAAEDGHLYVPAAKLLEEAGRLLDVATEQVRVGLDSLCAEERVVVRTLTADGAPGERIVYLAELWQAESRAAVRLRRILDAPARIAAAAAGEALRSFETETRFSLAVQQRRAVELALSAKVLVITGGPGTGKTTIVKAILHLLDRAKARVVLAAPTGRAAKRLAETCQREARTLHRLLEYSPKTRGFLRNGESPLPVDVAIVDEASMIDAVLFRSLLEALPDSARLILVGDRDQLPSVGPGQVLSELIASRMVDCVALDQVFRQAERSLIVVNAHRVHRGELPDVARTAEAGGDFFFVEREEPAELLAVLKELMVERIPRRFGLDSRRDVQVLAPMRRGLLGVQQLNTELQALLNPTGAPLARGRLRVGDRVIQLRNNYDLDVYNGDIGVVEPPGGGSVALVPDDDAGELAELVVNFDGRRIEYAVGECDQLALAYASSIHKSQGSEFPAVVILLHTQHYMLLQRNLLYTAITRGRRLVVLIGSRRAAQLAVANNEVGERYTLLSRLLAGAKS
ncbi:MAG: ATP-dependent RecD-like DNA helicase [Planctomycetota bacterium]